MPSNSREARPVWADPCFYVDRSLGGPGTNFACSGVHKSRLGDCGGTAAQLSRDVSLGSVTTISLDALAGRSITDARLELFSKGTAE